MQNEQQQTLFTSLRIESEIGIAEYQLAAKNIEEHQRTFNWAAGITSLISPVVAIISAGAEGIPSPSWLKDESTFSVEIGLLFFVFAYSLLSSTQFANITKNRVFAERKIITIRGMLGADYGDQSLVLPNWRLEGARHPFAIRMWKGTFGFYNLPVLLVYIFSFISFLYLSPYLLQLIQEFGFARSFSEQRFSILNSVLLTLLIALNYRRQLYDVHENFVLSIAMFSARIVKVRLVENIQYSIYRMKLNIAEARRLGFSFSEVEAMSIFIEDRRFKMHWGVSARALVAAIWRRLKTGKVSGGSTITQQLARTVFISDFSHPIRRKIVEIILAFWIDRTFSKNKIMEAYLTSVRFEDGVYGFHNASKHFDVATNGEPTKAEAFFLIERIANIRKRFKSARVEDLLSQALENGILNRQDVSEILSLYSRKAKEHLQGGSESKSPEEMASTFKL